MPPYYIGLCLIKTSLILQYLRFFRHTLSRICYSLLLLVFSTALTWTLLSAFQCRPIRAFWDIVPGSKCISLVTVNYSFLAVNAITDIILLVLPMPKFWELRLRRAEKRGLMVIFGLGGLYAFLLKALHFMRQ